MRIAALLPSPLPRLISTGHATLCLIAALLACAPLPAQTAPAADTARPNRMLGVQSIRQIPQSRDGSRAEPDDLNAAIKAALALPPATATPAPFLGNFTVITASSGDGLILSRQADCSLGAGNVPYSFNTSNPYGAPLSTTAHYDQVLHLQAGLRTTGGKFPNGCVDPKIGIVSSDLLYAGHATGGNRTAAVTAYNSTAQNNVLYTFVTKDDGTFISSLQQPLPAPNAPYGVAAGDLNGDGNPDLVAVGWQFVNGTSGSAATVLLGKADGTFTVGATYPLGAGITDSVVIDDFDGDGKLDFVIPVNGGNSKFSRAGSLAFFHGNGDGTFATPKMLALAAGAESFASGDVNGDGKKDLVSGTGLVLLGNGDGTFQPQATAAFPLLTTNSSAVAQVALGDFNADGKLDIAAGTGAAIRIYLGNGDGTFTVGNAYAGIDNHGYLAATDLDGDGILDIYSGNAQGGVFTGDDFSANEGYALMGLGNGFFSGAPVLDYAGFNTLQDLNGDGKPDFIGLAGNALITSKPVFGSYYGRGDGTFQQNGAGLPVNNFTSNGKSYSLFNVDSYVTPDLNGDGHADILFLPVQYSNQPPRIGFLSALGNTDGSFQTPVFTPAPTLSAGEEAIQSLTTLKSATSATGRTVIVYTYIDESYVATSSTTGGVLYTQGYATQVSNGDGTFAAPAVTVQYSATSPTTAPPVPPEVLAFTDLNGDRIPDLVTFVPTVFASGGVITSQSALQVMLGKADGTFGAATTVPVVGSPVDSSLAIGDLNGDGIPDIAIEGSVPAAGSTNTFIPQIGIALGKGDGTFTVLTPLNAGTGTEALSIGDYTGDGKADLAVVGPLQVNGIFPGNGDGTLQSTAPVNGNVTSTPPLQILLYNSAGSSSPALGYDVNGDGKLDLIAGSTVLLQSAVPVTLAGSTTTLAATPASATTGTAISLSATVTGAAGSGTPTGTITFMDGSTSLGTATLDSTGKATLSVSTLAVGTHPVVASYSSDTTFAASASATVNVTVTAIPPAASTTVLTASASSIRIGGSVSFTAKVSAPTGNSKVPTGSVQFLAGTTVLGTIALDATGSASFSTTTLPVGTPSITAQYAGDTSFASSTSAAVTVTVLPQLLASTTTLTASTTTPNLGQSVRLTATVAGPSGITTAATGTVTFLAGTATLGTGTLSGGMATLAVNLLPAGASSVTAMYGGDTTFAGSTSAPVTVTVSSVPSDFTLSLSPGSASVASGSPATTTVTVQPAGGFSSAVTFACSGLPANATCAFSPAMVTPSGSAPATAQLTIATGVQTSALHPLNQDQAVVVACTLLGLLGLGSLRKHQWSAGLLTALAFLALLTSLSGCGGASHKTPSGTGTVTITATAGTTSQAATFTLTVQ